MLYLFHLPITRHALRAWLFVAIHDASAIQIVGTQLHCDLVSRQNANKVLPHAARDVRQHLMLIFQFYPERCIWQGLNDRCHNLNCIFLRQAVPCSRLAFGRPFPSLAFAPCGDSVMRSALARHPPSLPLCAQSARSGCHRRSLPSSHLRALVPLACPHSPSAQWQAPCLHAA